MKTTSSPVTRSFRVLAIDGGGIRGVIPAAFLARVSEQLNLYEPLYRYFDLISGTSTGGLIALGLALGRSPEDLVNLYRQDGASIFSQSLRRYGFGLLTHKYSNGNLQRVLKNLFQESIIGDAKTRLCIPTINFTTRDPKVIKTRHLAEFNVDWRRKVWEVGMATSAAPVYFPLYIDRDKAAYVDGGLWANNPTMVGIVEGLTLGYSLDEIKVLSIGCGDQTFTKSRWATKTLGALGWNTDIVTLTMQVQSKSTELASRLLCKNITRINPTISTKWKLDAVGKLDDLYSVGLETAQQEATNLKPIFFSNTVTPFSPIP